MVRIGVDIGGTNIKLAIIDVSGNEPRIVTKTSFPFGHVENEVLCRRIYDSSLEMMESAGIGIDEIEKIGISVPGSIDQKGDILLHAYNMGYHNQPVKPELQKHFPDKQIVMINDANAAALAEYHAGALIGCDTSLLLTLGTGLGCGLIINGKLFNGGQNRGSEPGHLPFKSGDIPCTCGMSGCMERYTTVYWIIEKGKKEIGEYITEAKQITDLAKEGDPKALAIMNEYVENLAIILAGFCNVFDPQRIAIGGGISAAGDILFGSLEDLVEQKTFYRARYEIVPAHFLNDAGSIGSVYA